MSGQLKTFAKLNAEVKPIQGLYDQDPQGVKFYCLLARVLLAGFSENTKRKENKNDGGKSVF